MQKIYAEILAYINLHFYLCIVLIIKQAIIENEKLIVLFFNVWFLLL